MGEKNNRSKTTKKKLELLQSKYDSYKYMNWSLLILSSIWLIQIGRQWRTEYRMLRYWKKWYMYMKEQYGARVEKLYLPLRGRTITLSVCICVARKHLLFLKRAPCFVYNLFCILLGKMIFYATYSLCWSIRSSLKQSRSSRYRLQTTRI